jgi:hypothetical protein
VYPASVSLASHRDVIDISAPPRPWWDAHLGHPKCLEYQVEVSIGGVPEHKIEDVQHAIRSMLRSFRT